jgi:DNA-binding SARP family transcriptional activator/tetratricopeptide (TPR) repeat protein
MNFKLLGPVEIVANGRQIPVAAPREQIVLAMLLLEANRVVPVSRLIDAVWGDAPPRTARGQIQICVSSLRRLIARAGASDVIETRPAGYLIRVADEDLDLRQFEQFASLAASEAQRHPAEAVRSYRAGLALWHGPLAGGVESRIIQASAARLDETRLAAIEKCLELELHLGHHHSVTSELTKLVADHPLRERLRGQLMLALYRSGRQAEALQLFRETRDYLAEELGLDPSDDLQDLERAILLKDIDLGIPGGALRGRVAGPIPLMAPQQLPPTVPNFIGRAAILDQIRAALAPEVTPVHPPPVAVVTLTGPGGIGKTALAVHAAHLMTQCYPDGQLFARLMDRADRPADPHEVLGRFLWALGVAPETVPDSLDGRAALYRSCLAERRTLIVLDDVLSLSQVIPLLPGGSNCGVIITARNRIPWPYCVHEFEVCPLEEKSGVELLTAMIGQDRADHEQDSLLALARLCECFPLALRILGAKLSSRPYQSAAAVVQRLRDEHRRLDELDLEGLSMRATFSVSYENLDDDSRRLFRRLGMFRVTDFPSWIVAPLLDADLGSADGLLERLAEARLLETRLAEDGLVRFQFHDLLRLYAVERLFQEESAADRDQALRRLLACWLFLAREAQQRLTGGNSAVLHGSEVGWALPDDIIDSQLRNPTGWLQQERTGLVAAIFEASHSGFDEVCWDLATTSVTSFESLSHTEEWAETHKAALDTVRAAGNRKGEAALLHSLGVLSLKGSLRDATRNFSAALQIFADIGDRHGRALAMSGLAFVYRLSGRYADALSLSGEALAGFRQVGDHVYAAHSLGNMAQIHIDHQHYDAAEQVIRQALQACRHHGDSRVAAQIEYQHAELRLHRGDLPNARDLFESVLLSTRQRRDAPGQAYALLGLGTVRVRLGALSQAAADLAEALDLADHARDLLLYGRVLLGLAELDMANGQNTSAMARLRAAGDIFGDLSPAMVWRARTLALIGKLGGEKGALVRVPG